MTRSLVRTFALLVVLALALSAPAAAQNSPLGGYGKEGEETQSGVQGQSQDQSQSKDQSQSRDGDHPSRSDGASRSSDGGTLPFTGAELGWFGAAGLALFLVGFALRRLTAAARPT